jgi:hypothetical protein
LRTEIATELKHVIEEKKTCPRCKTKKPDSEYYIRKDRKGRAGLSGFCKKCMCEDRTDRAREFKRRCVEYKGGKCERCGYNRCDWSIDFHHRDPNEKDFGLGKQRRTRFDDKIKKELDKCMILCSNCHREKHAGLF